MPKAINQRGSRLLRALAIRAALLPWMREHGQLLRTSGIPHLNGRIADFLISLRTPFSLGGMQQRFQSRGCTAYDMAMLRQQGWQGLVTLPWGINVWPNGYWDGGHWVAGPKVMNLEWDDGAQTNLLSFRGGDWEERLLRALAA